MGNSPQRAGQIAKVATTRAARAGGSVSANNAKGPTAKARTAKPPETAEQREARLAAGRAARAEKAETARIKARVAAAQRQPGETEQQWLQRFEGERRQAAQNTAADILAREQASQTQAHYQNDAQREAVHAFAVRNADVLDREASNTIRRDGSFVEGKDLLGSAESKNFTKTTAADSTRARMSQVFQGAAHIHSHMGTPLPFSFGVQQGDWAHYVYQNTPQAFVTASLGRRGQVVYSLTPSTGRVLGRDVPLWPTMKQYHAALETAYTRYGHSPQTHGMTEHAWSMAINRSLAEQTGVKFGYEIINAPAGATRSRAAGSRSSGSRRPRTTPNQ